MIQAKSFIKSGMATKCLIIGCDTLSRILDENDRDSMIYADGSGATILEKTLLMMGEYYLINLLLSPMRVKMILYSMAHHMIKT